LIGEPPAPLRRFAADSPLEEGGFEPLVPLTLNATNASEGDKKIAMTPLRRMASQARPISTGPPPGRGKTPLEIAEQAGRSDVVTWLLEKGATRRKKST
jgi:hypothetical protein